MSTQQDLPVQISMLDDGLEPPTYATEGDAGADLRSTTDLVLLPGERALVPTGVAMALPSGYVGLVHPRSGLAARHGVTIVNAPGTVDAGYRGEIKVCLLNTDAREPVRISRGDRIAQLLIQRVEHARFSVVQELPASARGTGGFGSTGGFTGAGTAARPEDGPPAHRAATTAGSTTESDLRHQ
ncbi:dUTP diphosphatase [Arthrobacter sp. RIT-PI-e]|uniref:dUTP diphosphatase n=1 Tax=Arthrobacter sp. RIT-PI-e TaxID=1681197 RepID=UPI000AFC5283|nr:dUTP diphosphatase [Arthrobacter sp. RIT-PI-e]